jgi:hypothetical protein
MDFDFDRNNQIKKVKVNFIEEMKNSIELLD